MSILKVNAPRRGYSLYTVPCARLIPVECEAGAGSVDSVLGHPNLHTP
jgi:hypothetical protein